MKATWTYYAEGTPPGRWLLWLDGDVIGMAIPMANGMWATYHVSPGGPVGDRVMQKGARCDDIEAAKLTVESACASRGVL